MKIRHAVVLLCLGVALFPVAGCGDDDSSTPNDTEAPTIVSAAADDSSHVTLVFSEPMARKDTYVQYNYYVYDVGNQGALNVLGASLAPDNHTVILTTEGMSAVGYRVWASDISDMAGNSIDTTQVAFTGSTAPDVTAPVLFYRYPAPGASSISINTPIEFSFSENFDSPAFDFELTGAPGGQPISSQFGGWGTTWVGSVSEPLDYDRTYTISLKNIFDPAGNRLPDVVWTFHTVKQY